MRVHPVVSRPTRSPYCCRVAPSPGTGQATRSDHGSYGVCPGPESHGRPTTPVRGPGFRGLRQDRVMKSRVGVGVVGTLGRRVARACGSDRRGRPSSAKSVAAVGAGKRFADAATRGCRGFGGGRRVGRGMIAWSGSPELRSATFDSDRIASASAGTWFGIRGAGSGRRGSCASNPIVPGRA